MALARSSGLMQDVHLMVSNPDEHFEAFAKAGAKHLTFHIEVRHGASALDMIKRIHDLGCTAGVCLNPATPVEALGSRWRRRHDSGDERGAGVHGAGVHAGGAGEGEVSAARVGGASAAGD